MRLNYYLDKPDRPTTPVMVNLALCGKRFRFSTGVTVDPKHWSDERQAVKSGDPHQNAHQKRLNAITAFIQRAYNELTPSGVEKLLTNADLSSFIQSVKHFIAPTPDEGSEHGTTFVARFDQFIDTYTLRSPQGMVTSKRPGERMLSLYRLVLRDLQQWTKETRRNLTYEMIDETFYVQYCGWLSNSRGLVDSTISNHIKVLKTFMKWSRSKGYHTSSAWETFWRDKRTGDTIALSIDELRRLRDLDLEGNDRLAHVRDVFLLQTYTGLRYGDLIELKPHHFASPDSIIRYTTEKTDTRCLIPITKPMSALLKRYPDHAFKFPSNAKMNEYLKELGKLVGLDQSTTVNHYRGGKREEEQVLRAELLTTHVARRTFVSTSIRLGVPEAVISMVTGHATKGMLQQHYIVFDEEAVREMICKAWEQL
ncbi:MAG: site-specific integrase [Bacteroidetes bacterium]|nr:site-specific integrase [Bacteroidota bacterium]